MSQQPLWIWVSIITRIYIHIAMTKEKTLNCHLQKILCQDWSLKTPSSKCSKYRAKPARQCPSCWRLQLGLLSIHVVQACFSTSQVLTHSSQQGKVEAGRFSVSLGLAWSTQCSKAARAIYLNTHTHTHQKTNWSNESHPNNKAKTNSKVQMSDRAGHCNC